jgi:hypothetical protein
LSSCVVAEALPPRGELRLNAWPGRGFMQCVAADANLLLGAEN